MVKAISCPSCGGAVSIKYAESSLSCVCYNCLTVLSLENESVAVLKKAQKKMASPIIGLGLRYKFRGHEWEVIGYLLRSDQSENYKWSEYLLFNPYVGYRFLVCMDGHWSYVVKTKSAPKVDVLLKQATYLNKNYNIFHKGGVKTLFVLGEFYWKVKTDEVVQATDYISPPEMLSLEKDSDEEIWSLGEYVPRGDIEKAFKLVGLMPLDIGVAPHQPSPHSDSGRLKTYFSYLLIVLFISHFAFVVLTRRNEILTQSFDVPSAQGTKIQTQSFTVDDRMGYVEAKLFASVDNNWFEYTADVVNENSEDDYEYDQGVEFYSGYDSDGRWTEGSQTSERRLAKLAPGRYHLNITTASGSSGPMRFDILLSQGNLSWGNFFFALFLITLYPVYYLMRSKKFEKDRWSQSDYSPYWRAVDDD